MLVFGDCDFHRIMRCFSRVMIWGEREALQAGKKLCCVCLQRCSDGCSLLKKTLSPKTSDISSLGTQSGPLLKSQQRANSQSSTRVKTVNRGKHTVESENTGNKGGHSKKVTEWTLSVQVGGSTPFHSFWDVFPNITESNLDDESNTKTQNLPPKSDHLIKHRKNCESSPWAKSAF